MAYTEKIGPKQRERERDFAERIRSAGLVSYKVERDTGGNYRWEFRIPGGMTLYACNLHDEAIAIIDQAPRAHR